jgi:hypothetical protein
LEDDQVEVDLFDMRVDENSKLLEMPEERDKYALTSDDQVKLFVQKTRELLERERGKSEARKLNLGDTISTKIESSVIIQ